uniref:YTH domain-containing protein n=1 Tax=Glossina brevipalpis TaxID=37001 RepID=A0A1A9WC88_9MUSC
MKIMADLDAVHLGLDENEADIAEELQHFDESFDTRSEASESGSESSDSQPSISSVSTVPSTKSKEKVKAKTKKPQKAPPPLPPPPPIKNTEKKSKRVASPSVKESAVNGKNASKKKRSNAETKSSKSTESKEPVESKKSETVDSKKSRKKSSEASQSVAVNSGNAEVSDEEVIKPKTSAVPFDSDSESEDSDSAANIKRNGRKNPLKSTSPEKKGSTNAASGGGKSVSLYDYKTKLNYLFRDTRFFLIKSNNSDNVNISKSQNVWATLPQNDANLSQAFKEARNVLLIFSVNESGKFAGFARMSASSRRDITQPAWVLPPSMSSRALGGVIEIDWICRKELSFNCTSHLYNSWNEGKPVKIGRDGQEIEPKVGAELCRLFPEDEKIELTPILRKSKETAKMMREKNIRVVYKPPKSLSTRGGIRGNTSYRHGGHERREVGGGPMRHKRAYGSGPHRPYKLPAHLGHPSTSYKRSGSPYRSGPGGGPGSGGGGSRAGGGDTGLPPWERYMTPAAAAEAYLADYMRTMHGQLPPLPFVPPFGQLPPPTPGNAAVPPSGGSASIYEQLPPPVRYYDGPPLPDYPPPQPIRPPPPGFDKSAPSYEDFAAWKHAGLPTGSLSTGFPPSLSGSNGNNTGPGGNSGSAGGGGGSSSQGYRGNRGSDVNNSNINRTRERNSRGGDRDRHFRANNERSGRSYRDNRR